VADITPITIARFWSKVDVSSRDEDCWLWQGSFAGSGYGCFRIPEDEGRVTSAHRVAYRLATGEWPPAGLLVRHKCDTPACVNPFHLETGSHLDNSRDMLDRERVHHRVQAGEENFNSKLSRADVETVREMIAAGRTNVDIGKRFGVHHATISRIRRGTAWARGS
jgi:hypothetical protein